MSKKNVLISIIIFIIILISGLVLWWLNSNGYIKILGSTNYFQKVESLNSNSWTTSNGYSKIDFSSGGLRLHATTVQGQAQDTTNSITFNKCCGSCGNCSLTPSISGNHEFYLPPNTYLVMITGIGSDDYYTSLIVNNNTIISNREKYHPDTNITPYMNLTGVNRITATAIDTAGGNIAYGFNIVSYQHGQTPPATTSFDNSGYYVTKKFGADDLYSFDKLVFRNENKPSGTDIYYQFLPVADNSQVLTDNSQCASAGKCISSVYRSSGGEINLKNVTELAKWKFFALRINFSSSNGSYTPNLDGLDVYYTTQLIIPNYQLINTYSYQSKSTTQSKQIKIKVLDNANSVRFSQDPTLINNQTQITLPDNVSGNLKIYTKAKKHLSRKIEKIINSDAQLSFDKFLAGDFNEDDTINSLDWSIVNQYWGKENPDYDVTGDDVINSLDWSIVNSNWGKRGDGLIDNISF